MTAEFYNVLEKYKDIILIWVVDEFTSFSL